jgi:DNA-binding NtrC family response regulator
MTRLLLVDDDEAVRITLAANLELEGFEIVEADSAEAALACVATAKADVVLSDVRMGGMNGVELLLAMRRSHPDLPVVLTTAFSSEDLLKRAYLGGAFTVLPKPFALHRAISTLQRATRRPHVLVVDDAIADADALAGAIRNAGSSARSVYDATMAIDEVRTGKYDVVVTDLKMRDDDGATLAARVRTLDPSIAVIAYSTQNLPDIVRRVADVGVNSIMRKPLDPAKLIEAIAIARSDSPTPPRAG